MMESLYFFKSRIRRDLFALFFSNPAQAYYLREMSRLLGCSAGSLRRELLKFERDGLLKTQRRGNLVFYSLDPTHPLYRELKSIVAKTVGIAGRLKRALTGVPGIQTAFIYGSFASGRENSSSDIDVFIIGEAELKDLSPRLRKLEKGFQREINITLYGKDEYLRNKSAMAGFFEDIFKKPKIMLLGKEDDL